MFAVSHVLAHGKVLEFIMHDYYCSNDMSPSLSACIQSAAHDRLLVIHAILEPLHPDAVAAARLGILSGRLEHARCCNVRRLTTMMSLSRGGAIQHCGCC